MANIDVLKSYLVRLGFEVDHPTLAKFNDALRTVQQAVEKTTMGAGGIAPLFAKAGFAVLTTLTGIATGVTALIDHVANADLEFQLLARRMFMSADAARTMSIALDALGVSAQDVVWGPKELQDRYQALVNEQNKIEGGFVGGGTVEERLKKLRDLRFEFTRLQVAATELSRGFAVSLFDRLFGDGKGQQRLHDFVEYIIDSVPRIADQLASALAPALRDTYKIWTELVDIAKLATHAFLQFIGAIYGDKKLERGTVSIENMGRALDHVAHTLEQITGFIDRIVKFVTAHPQLSGVLLGGAGGAVVGSFIPGIGTLGGAAIGVVGGGLLGKRAFEAQSGKGEVGLRQHIADIANALGIDPAIAEALIHRESNFNQSARGKAGEIGLTQLMPATARGLGIDPYDADANIKGGLLYLLRQKQQFGDWTTALEAYNAGPGAVSGGHVPDSSKEYAAAILKDAAGMRGGGAGSTINVGSVVVNVSQPNATQEQIQQAVVKGIKEAADKQLQNNMLQVSGAY